MSGYSFEGNRPGGKVPGLDGLRAIAVILVVFAHWGLPPGMDHPLWKKLLPGGGFGVDLFFVISGFLITGILMRSASMVRTGTVSRGHALLIFYARRALRIFPIYYLLVCGMLIANHPGVRDNWLYYITYTENVHVFIARSWNSFSHTWSLAVEEQFYLLWPLIVLSVPARLLTHWMVGCIIIGPLFSFLQTRMLGNSFWVLMPSCVEAFAVGGLVAMANNRSEGARVMRVVGRLLPVSLVLYGYWALAPLGGHLQCFERLNNSVIAAGLVQMCVNGKCGLLNWPVLTRIGTVSYGIYLYHYVLPHYWSWGTGPMGYYSMWAVLLLTAAGSYTLIEKPMLRMKRFFTLVPPADRT